MWRARGATLGESQSFTVGEVQFLGGEIVPKLLEPLGPQDDRRDNRLCQQPRDRDAGRAALMDLRDRSHRAEDLPAPLLVHDRKVELRPTPTPETHLFGLQKRNEFALEVATGDGVVGLECIEAPPAGVR